MPPQEPNLSLDEEKRFREEAEQLGLVESPPLVPPPLITDLNLHPLPKPEGVDRQQVFDIVDQMKDQIIDGKFQNQMFSTLVRKVGKEIKEAKSELRSAELGTKRLFLGAGPVSVSGAEERVKGLREFIANRRDLLKRHKPDDNFRALIDGAIREATERGILPNGQALLQDDFRDPLINKAASNIMKTYYNLGLHELIPRLRDANDPDVDRVDAQLRSAIVFQTILQDAPLTDEEYGRSSLVAIRTALAQADRELRFFTPENVEALKAGGDAAAVLEAEQVKTALADLQNLNQDQAAEIRAMIAMRPWYELRNPVERERVKKRRLELEARSEPAPGDVMTAPASQTLAEKMAVRLQTVLGPDWDKIIGQLTKESDVHVRLRPLGILTDGVNLQRGVMEPSAQGFTPFHLLEDRGVPEYLARAQATHGSFAKGFIPPTAEEVKLVLSGFLESGQTISKEQQSLLEQLTLVDFLRDFNEQVMADALAGRSDFFGEAHRRQTRGELGNIPAPIVSFGRTIGSISEMLEGGQELYSSLIESSGDIPLVRDTVQGFIESRTNNPGLAEAFDDPNQALKFWMKSGFMASLDDEGKPLWEPVREWYDTLPPELQRAYLEEMSKPNREEFFKSFDAFREQDLKILSDPGRELKDLGPVAKTQMVTLALLRESFRLGTVAAVDAWDYLTERPEDIPLLLFGGRFIIGPIAKSMRTAVQRAARLKRVSQRLGNLVHRTPGGTREAAKELRRIARNQDMPLGPTKLSEKQVTDQIGWLSAQLDTMASLVEDGKRLGLRDVTPAVVKLMQIAPELTRAGNVMGRFIEAAKFVPFAKQPFRKILDFVREPGVSLIRPIEDKVVSSFSKRLSSEFEDGLFRGIVNDTEFTEKAAFLHKMLMLRPQKPTAAERARITEIQKELNSLIESRVKAYVPPIAPTTMDTLVAELEAGKFGNNMFRELDRLRRRLTPGQRRASEKVFQEIRQDYNTFFERLNREAQPIQAAEAAGMMARVRRDLLYDIAERKLADDIRLARKGIEINRRELELQGTEDWKKVRLDEIATYEKEIAQAERLLQPLRQERREILAEDSFSQVILSVGKKDNPRFKPDLFLSKAVSEHEMVMTMRAFPELFGRHADEFLLPDGSVDPNMKQELFRLFESRGRSGLKQDAQEVLRELESQPQNSQARKRLNSLNRLNSAGMPVQQIGKSFDDAAHAASLQVNAQLTRGKAFAENFAKLSDSDQMALAEALRTRNATRLKKMIRDKHPWVESYVRSMRPDIELGKVGGKVNVLAGEFGDWWDTILDRAMQSGFISKADHNVFMNRSFREVNLSRLFERPKITKTEEVASATEAGIQNEAKQLASGFIADELRFQRPLVKWRVNSVDKQGGEVNRLFETKAEALSFIRETWGQNVAKTLKGKSKTGSVSTANNAVGNEVVLASPHGEDMLELLDIGLTQTQIDKRLKELRGDLTKLEKRRQSKQRDFLIKKQKERIAKMEKLEADPVQPAAQLKRMEQLLLDLGMNEYLQAVEGVGGHLISPAEFNRRFASMSALDKGVFERNFKTLPNMKRRFGKYAGWRISREALSSFVDSQRAYDRFSGYMEGLQEILLQNEGIVRRAAAKAGALFDQMHRISKTSLILASERTWVANATFNTVIDLMAGTGVMNPRNFLRNAETLAEFKRLRQIGKIHPLEQEMIEDGIFAQGFFEKASFTEVQEFFIRAMSGKDGKKLAERLKALEAIHSKEALKKAGSGGLDSIRSEYHADQAFIDELEVGMARKIGREVGGFFVGGKTKIGLPRSKSGELLRDSYNAIDQNFRVQAWLNLRKVMPREAASQQIKLFFQDYARVPALVKQIGTMPILGSLAPSFAYEAVRIGANFLRHKPLNFTSFMAAIPTWNFFQMVKAGMSPERFFGQMRTMSGPNSIDLFSRFMTTPVLTDERGDISTAIPVSQVFNPFPQLIEGRGLIRAAFDAYSPPETRSGILLGITPLVNVASQFVGNTPAANSLLSFFPMPNGRRLIDPENASVANVGKAILTGLIHNYVPPLTPFGIGRDTYLLREALVAGVDSDTQRPYRSLTPLDALGRMFTGVGFRGRDPLGIATTIADEFKDFLNSGSAGSKVARFLLALPADQKITFPGLPKAASEEARIKSIILGEADSAFSDRLSVHGLRSDIRYLMKRLALEDLSSEERASLERQLKETERRMRDPKKDAAFDKLFPDKDLTYLQAQRLRDNLERSSVKEAFGDLRLDRQVKSIIRMEMEQMDESTVGSFVERTFRTDLTGRIGREEDPELVLRAMIALESRIRQRGGSVEWIDDRQVVFSEYEPYVRQFEILKKLLAISDGAFRRGQIRRGANERRREAVEERFDLTPDFLEKPRTPSGEK